MELKRLTKVEYGHAAAQADGSLVHGDLFVDDSNTVRFVSHDEQAELTPVGPPPNNVFVADGD